MVSAYNILQVNRPEQAEQLLQEEIASALENSLEIDTSNRLEAMLAFYNLLPTNDVDSIKQEDVLADLGL
jgi:hypothetical protein